LEGGGLKAALKESKKSHRTKKREERSPLRKSRKLTHCGYQQNAQGPSIIARKGKRLFKIKNQKVFANARGKSIRETRGMCLPASKKRWGHRVTVNKNWGRDSSSCSHGYPHPNDSHVFSEGGCQKKSADLGETHRKEKRGSIKLYEKRKDKTFHRNGGKRNI